MRPSSKATGLAGGLLLLATSVAPVFASSHREAPLISTDAAADHTDVFAWVDGTAKDHVNLVVNVSPMQDPAGGPNFWEFDPSVAYDIKIDNDRNGKADVTYRFKFSTIVRNQRTFLYNTGQVTSPADTDLNVRQSYTVTRIDEDGDSHFLDGTDRADQRRAAFDAELRRHRRDGDEVALGWHQDLRRPAR